MGNLEELAEIFKALSDPTRLKIVQLLVNKKFLCVNAITKQLVVSQSAVSQHLRILKQTGLVNNERKGYHIHYSINNTLLKKYKKLSKEILGEN